MPVDIPALTKMNCRHFLVVYFVHCESLLRVRNIFAKVEHRSIVHEVACVDGDICLELLVSAGVATTFSTLVFNIIDYQTSVVNEFCHATTEVDIFIGFEFFDIFTT